MDTAHLKELLKKQGVTQAELARTLGRDKSVITMLMQGKRRLKADEAATIARMLGVPVAEVLGLDEPVPQGVSESALIPFQHEPVKSKSARQVIKKKGKFYLEETGTFSAKAYALEVTDDSMNLAGILPGDIVISELDRPCRKGQVVIAQHYTAGGAKTILRRYEPPMLTPHSTSAAYRALSEDDDDVRIVSPVMKLVRLW